jgi:hypothetical protein
MEIEGCGVCPGTTCSEVTGLVGCGISPGTTGAEPDGCGISPGTTGAAASTGSTDSVSAMPVGKLGPLNGTAVGVESTTDEGDVTSFSRAVGGEVVGKADTSTGVKTGSVVSSDGCPVWFDINDEGAIVG